MLPETFPSAYSFIGKSPLEVSREGLAALANTLIESGEIHINGSIIAPGRSKIEPPLKIVPRNADFNSLAEFLSQG